jgi:hypothetical protein
MSIKDEINFPIVSYPFVCVKIPVTPPYGCLIFQYDIIEEFENTKGVIRIRISNVKTAHIDWSFCCVQ